MKTLSFFTSAVVLLCLIQCTDEQALPLVILDEVEKGAYPRLVKESDNLLDLFDVDGSVYEYKIEFIDADGGNLVEEYVVDLYFEDNSPGNEDKSTGPYEFIRLDASDFEDGKNGYKEAPSIRIEGRQVLDALDLVEDDVYTGDVFKFKARVTMKDGRVFSNDNSSATISGSGFRGHFNFTMRAACSSDLEGFYEYTLLETFCGNIHREKGKVEIIALGDGVYSMSDWSLGALDNCSLFCFPMWGNLSFTEICGEVSFTGFEGEYGAIWEFKSEIEGENWTISFSNTFEESGTSVINFPGGVPFTLAE